MLLRLLDTPQGVWQGTVWGGGGKHHQHSHNPSLSVLAQSSHGDPGILTHAHTRAHTQAPASVPGASGQMETEN